MLAALGMIAMFVGFVVFCVLCLLGIFFSSDAGATFTDVFNWVTSNGLGALVLGVLFLVGLAVVAFINALIVFGLIGLGDEYAKSNPLPLFILTPLLLGLAPLGLTYVWGEYKMVSIGSLLLFAVSVLYTWYENLQSRWLASGPKRKTDDKEGDEDVKTGDAARP